MVMRMGVGGNIDDNVIGMWMWMGMRWRGKWDRVAGGDLYGGGDGESTVIML